MGSASRGHPSRQDEVSLGTPLKLMLACLAFTTALNILLPLIVATPLDTYPLQDDSTNYSM